MIFSKYCIKTWLSKGRNNSKLFIKWESKHGISVNYPTDVRSSFCSSLHISKFLVLHKLHDPAFSVLFFSFHLLLGLGQFKSNLHQTGYERGRNGRMRLYPHQCHCACGRSRKNILTGATRPRKLKVVMPWAVTGWGKTEAQGACLLQMFSVAKDLHTVVAKEGLNIYY